MSMQERNYRCQRCLNHGKVVFRKGHACKFKSCRCTDCRLNEERKQCNRKIVRNQKNSRLRPANDDSRQQYCTLCRNHLILVELKGHKKDCPYKTCPCQMCSDSKTHRNIMAQQTKNRRKQKRLTKVLPEKPESQEKVQNQGIVRPDPVRPKIHADIPKPCDAPVCDQHSKICPACLQHKPNLVPQMLPLLHEGICSAQSHNLPIYIPSLPLAYPTTLLRVPWFSPSLFPQHLLVCCYLSSVGF